MRRKKNLIPRTEKLNHLLFSNPSKNKGRWRDIVGYDCIKLEIGCGKGGFITQLAQREPQNFFIGMEKEQNVLLSCLEKTEKLQLTNVKFIDGDAQVLLEIFEKCEIDQLFLNFSDPWPSSKHEKRRLTYRTFLESYSQILKEEALLTFKTDNLPLFDFSLLEFEQSGWKNTFLSYDLPVSDDNIQTEYETRFRELGTPINKISAFFPK